MKITDLNNFVEVALAEIENTQINLMRLVQFDRSGDAMKSYLALGRAKHWLKEFKQKQRNPSKDEDYGTDCGAV